VPVRKRYKLSPESNGASNTVLELEDLRGDESDGYIDVTLTFPGAEEAGQELSVGLSTQDAEELVEILREMLDEDS